MTYSSLHRFLLRTVASRGVLALTEAEEIVNKFSEDESHLPVKDLVKQINDEIRPYQQSLKVTSNELTDEEVIVFLSLGYDDATKSQNLFSATELEYFKILLEEIMSTETRQITGIHSINLVSKMKVSFTKTDAQRLLNTWCRMHYLEKDGNSYALGVRSIHEFESYLRQNMPDTIEECCLCKQIVFRGCNCPSCSLAVHTRCLNRYLEKVEKWPCCKTDFSASQLERLNSESSRIMQSQQPDMTRQHSEMFDTAVDATQDCSDELDPSQDIIPEISQRVTRKRKRT